MRGKAFSRRRWWSASPTWDHDHCVSCWRDFSDREYDIGDGERALIEGFTTRGPPGVPEDQQRDDYHWVCPTCFEDFKEHLGWRLLP